ncbi:hypothetical protein D3C81_2114450 [compost metagenome]
MTSALAPLVFSSSSAAFTAVCTIAPYASTVTSVPSRTTLALPMGTVYSPSGTSPRKPRYSFRCSITNTGSLSRMALINSPLAS